MKLEYSRRISEKNDRIPNFLKIPSSGNRVVQCGQTDGNYEAGSRFSLFCERAVTINLKKRGKLHPCTGTEALYSPYGP